MKAIICILFLTIVCSFFYERHQWNNGICRKSGRRWKNFDEDSWGSYGYTDGAGNYCWISWPFII